jgi:hypothetical protein
MVLGRVSGDLIDRDGALVRWWMTTGRRASGSSRSRAGVVLWRPPGCNARGSYSVGHPRKRAPRHDRAPGSARNRIVAERCGPELYVDVEPLRLRALPLSRTRQWRSATSRTGSPRRQGRAVAAVRASAAAVLLVAWSGTLAYLISLAGTNKRDGMDCGSRGCITSVEAVAVAAGGADSPVRLPRAAPADLAGREALTSHTKARTGAGPRRRGQGRCAAEPGQAPIPRSAVPAALRPPTSRRGTPNSPDGCSRTEGRAAARPVAGERTSLR